MSGRSPALVLNRGRCACTNALLAVEPRDGLFDGGASALRERLVAWTSAAGRLSCELEGHPLGGGLLKLEPGEARRVLLAPDGAVGRGDSPLLEEGIAVMRRWRHVA